MAGKFKMAFGGLVRSFHQLWLEVTGTFLLVFAVIFGYYAIKEYRQLQDSTTSGWVLGSAAALSVLTLSFGIHSLWKARKLR